MRNRLAGRPRRGIAGLGDRIVWNLKGATHAARGKAERAQGEEHDHHAKLETALHLYLLNPIHGRQHEQARKTAWRFKASAPI